VSPKSEQQQSLFTVAATRALMADGTSAVFFENRDAACLKISHVGGGLKTKKPAAGSRH